MHKLFTFILLSTLALASVSCSDNDDLFYVSTSGDGSIVIDYDSPIYLYRMVLFSDDDSQSLYLMGSSAYVDGSATFMGRGAVVKIIMPNDDDRTTLEASSFDIADSDYQVSYSKYVNYSNDVDDDDFTSLDSGSVLIRRVGNYYDLRLIGIDADSNNLLISYMGYIYRSFVYTEDSDTDDTDDSDDTDTDDSDDTSTSE